MDDKFEKKKKKEERGNEKNVKRREGKKSKVLGRVSSTVSFIV